MTTHCLPPILFCGVRYRNVQVFCIPQYVRVWPWMWTQGAGREAEPVREGQRKRALFLVYILYAWALACTSCTQSIFGWEEGRNAVHACIFQIATQKLYDCVYTTPKLLILLRLTEAEHYHVYYHFHANITGFSVIFEGCCVVL